MTIERFEIAGLAQNAYIIASNGRAVLIDPIRDIDRYTEYLDAKNLKLDVVLETHIHADFASGATALAAATGADLALSAYDHGELYQYSMPHRELRDGDTIKFGDARLQVLHTPGHTPEHLAFLLFDRSASGDEPAALFSGDFLFAGGIGRPDLLGEDAKLELARELYISLHQRIGGLPDTVSLLPGHGAGSFCGAGISDRAESTLGYERATNPLFGLEQGEFVRDVLASVPPMPTYYPRMKRLNAAGAPIFIGLPGDVAISPVTLNAFLLDDPIVLDVRGPDTFAAAHIAGSINIGSGPSLALWAGWLLDPTVPLILVSDRGDDEAARRSLVRVGLDSICGYLDGGVESWREAGLELVSLPMIAASETLAAGSLILDVRAASEFATGHIHGARNLVLGDLPAHLATIPRDVPLLLVCGTAYRSSIAASLLQHHGFTLSSSLEGGMAEWRRKLLPVVTC